MGAFDIERYIFILTSDTKLVRILTNLVLIVHKVMSQ